MPALPRSEGIEGAIWGSGHLRHDMFRKWQASNTSDAIASLSSQRRTTRGQGGTDESQGWASRSFK